VRSRAWISVFDSERPASKEEVLTLSYVGDFPAPEDLFADPDDRSYGVCTYFYKGDQDYAEESITDPASWIKRDLVEMTIEKEGFYCLDSQVDNQSLNWRWLATLKDGNNQGIVCWKHLDYPCP
jgi:hypothetical protein